MIIDKTHWIGSTYQFGFYKGCVATHSPDYKFLFVFTGMSPKRIKSGAFLSNLERYKHKIIFVSNKQLKDINFMPNHVFSFELARKILFDGKLGSRYQAIGKGYSCYGDYFSCFRPNTIRSLDK